MTARSWPLRLGLMVLLLVVGPATLAPGTADGPRRPSGGGTAGATWGWGKAQWDFAWEYGESLSSRPYRGSDIRHGRWAETTDGTGRAVKTGGGVQLQSGPFPNPAAPDRGTTRLTLQDQPATVGRWEVKVRTDQQERGATPYTVLIELVPVAPSEGGCARTVTIARIDPDGSTVGIGVDGGGRRWTRQLGGLSQGRAHERNHAVEITRSRITWLVDGRVVGSVGDRAALPTAPMTVRLSLVGGPETQEMNKTLAIFDWVRGWDLDRGRRLPTGPALTEGPDPAAC